METYNVELSAIINVGMLYLREKLGIIETEAFISAIRNDHFDYTQWRRDNLFSGESLEEINEQASEYERIHGTPRLRTVRKTDD
jgi:hypothetical protein